MFNKRDKNSRIELLTLEVLDYWNNLLKHLVKLILNNKILLFLIDNKFNKFRISVVLGQLWCLLCLDNRDLNSHKENNLLERDLYNS